MTKQEELEEGLGRLFYEMGLGETIDCESFKGRVLNYFHSQGTVMRVKCPSCIWGKFSDGVVGMTPCYRCDSTGYIIEPLIEEGKR